jgi:uncharacterized protein
MFDLIAALAVGFIGSLHCLGMCGPIVLAYSLQIEVGEVAAGTMALRKSLNHHIAFHSGRLLSYGLLGLLTAGLFHISGVNDFLKNFRGGIVLVGGILMVYFGLVLLKILPFPNFLSYPALGYGAFWGRPVSRLLKSSRVGSRIVLGWAVGFLPCGLSWAMIVRAAVSQSMVQGFLIMLAFGLGTVPALFLTGLSASFLSFKARVLSERVAALSILAMGLILILKGVRFVG